MSNCAFEHFSCFGFVLNFLSTWLRFRSQLSVSFSNSKSWSFGFFLNVQTFVSVRFPGSQVSKQLKHKQNSIKIINRISEPFLAMWSYMLPAIVIYIKKLYSQTLKLLICTGKTRFRSNLRKQNRFSIQTVLLLMTLWHYFDHLGPLWHQKNIQHTTLTTFASTKLIFAPTNWPISSYFFGNICHFGVPNLTYGKPDTYDPLISGKFGILAKKDPHGIQGNRFCTDLIRFGCKSVFSAKTWKTSPL